MPIVLVIGFYIVAKISDRYTAFVRTEDGTCQGHSHTPFSQPNRTDRDIWTVAI